MQSVRFGANNLNAMNFRADLGSALHRVGRSAEAIGVLRTVVQLREDALGAHSPQLLTALTNLAAAESGAGDTRAADASIDRALAIEIGRAHV